MLFAWLEPIAPTAPEVSINLPAPPDPLGPLGPVLGALAVLLIISVVLRRLLRGRLGAQTVFAFSIGVGNALMEVGAMLQPDRPKVTVSSEQDAPSASESETAGDGPLPEFGTPAWEEHLLERRRKLDADQPSRPHREPIGPRGTTTKQMPGAQS